jgi:hypothetical protein
MEVLIATGGVLVMGLVAYRWIYRKPPIIPEIIGAVMPAPENSEPTSAWATAFTGNDDWPWHRQGGDEDGRQEWRAV